MLALQFHAGNHRYALDAADVIEVLPLVNFETPAEAPECLGGLFAHRGVATFLVDLTLLLTGRPCPRRWNTRIMLVQFDADDMPKTIGLLAERVTTAEIETKTPTTRCSGMETLGPILLDENGLFQLVDLSRLFSAERRKRLRSALEERNA